MEEILKKLLEGQAGINNRLDSMDHKLDSLGNRMDTVENRLDSVEDKLDSLGSGQKEIYGMLRGWEESKSLYKNLEDKVVLYEI